MYFTPPSACVHTLLLRIHNYYRICGACALTCKCINLNGAVTTEMTNLKPLGEAWVVARRVHHHIALWTPHQPGCGAEAVLAGEPAVKHIVADRGQWEVTMRCRQFSRLLHTELARIDRKRRMLDGRLSPAQPAASQCGR